jgi:hypothetical protein
MMNIKRFIGFTLTAFFIVSAVAAPLAAQDAGGRASSGGTQRQTPLDINSLRDVTGSEGMDRRNKMLKEIAEVVAKGGDISDEIYAALEYMSKEGLTNKTYRQGQLLNDYPTVRRQVVDQLGKIGTAKATDILIQLCRNETVPDIQWEAISALGSIGINENGKTVDAIFSIQKLRRYDGHSTTDTDFERIVSSAIDAFDKIDKKNNGIGNRSKQVQEFLDNISKKHFPRRGDQVSIQDRAKQVLEDMIKKESQRRQES